MSKTIKGACFCGTVQIELTGDVIDMGYCHCTSCRQWSGDPIHAWTIWPSSAVVVTTGEEQIGTFHKTPESLSFRQFCKNCGGHLMIHHPKLEVYDIFPGILSGFDFQASAHINCSEWIMKPTDSLPKFKDFPAEYADFGGTGEMMPE